MPNCGKPICRSCSTSVVAVLAAALSVWLGCGRSGSCGGVLESPETQIRKALAGQSQGRLDDIYGFQAGGIAEFSLVRYADIVASVEGDRATVVALLEAEGHVIWRDGTAELSYLGREKFHLHPCRIAGWCAEGDQFARLRGVLLLLLRREDAFNARHSGGYASLVSERYRDQGQDRAALFVRLSRNFREQPVARQRTQAWQIRLDRGGAEVGEDYVLEIPGHAPQKLRARYTLVLEGERWVFAAGL